MCTINIINIFITFPLDCTSFKIRFGYRLIKNLAREKPSGRKTIAKGKRVQCVLFPLIITSLELTETPHSDAIYQFLKC